MEIVHYPAKVLLEDAEEIDDISPEIASMAEEMLDIMYRGGGIGLAAPQVGISKRLIVINTSAEPGKGEELVLVNPVLVRRSDELVTRSEGCLSFPGITGPVSRWSKVWVRARTLDGEEKEIEATGLLSIVLQHEIDHLNGILFITKLPPASRALIKKDLAKLREKAKAAQQA